MTISDIKALADEQGYSVSGNVKSLIIESFLEAQEKAVKGVPLMMRLKAILRYVCFCSEE